MCLYTTNHDHCHVLGVVCVSVHCYKSGSVSDDAVDGEIPRWLMFSSDCGIK